MKMLSTLKINEIIPKDLKLINSIYLNPFFCWSIKYQINFQKHEKS